MPSENCRRSEIEKAGRSEIGGGVRQKKSRVSDSLFMTANWYHARPGLVDRVESVPTVMSWQ